MITTNVCKIMGCTDCEWPDMSRPCTPPDHDIRSTSKADRCGLQLGIDAAALVGLAHTIQVGAHGDLGGRLGRDRLDARGRGFYNGWRGGFRSERHYDQRRAACAHDSAWREPSTRGHSGFVHGLRRRR
jgi:hypothetical protein